MKCMQITKRYCWTFTLKILHHYLFLIKNFRHEGMAFSAFLDVNLYQELINEPL